MLACNPSQFLIYSLFNMASTQSPVLAIPDIIDKILNTKEDASDFDLQQLVGTIDSLLHNWKPGKRSSTHDKFANAATFSEGVSKNVQRISAEISEYCGDKQCTAIAVLNAVGNVHWLGLGFLVVAAVVERFHTINKNKEECFKLLQSMNSLAKVLLQFKEFPRSKVKMQAQINKSISLIVSGAITCCTQTKPKRIKRFLNASNDQKKLNDLRFEVEDMYKNFSLQTSVESLSLLEKNLSISEESLSLLEKNLSISEESLSILDTSLKCNPPRVSNDSDAVGIEQQVVDVGNLLELDEEKPAVAVVVHGIGGSGKTTLADAVLSYLKDRLQGWRYSKIILIKNLERHPNVEELQSLILEDLTGLKQNVRDLESGQQSLKDIMEKESIFLYIDNALYIEPLQDLLPTKITPKKLRLLITARKTNVIEVMKDCRIKPCKIFTMEPLPLEAAIEVLRRKIDEGVVNSIVEKNSQVKEIAERCRCCPLFLEVVGGYLRKRENEGEAYERVIGWLEHGEPFCGDKDYSFNDKRIMFAYHELVQSAQEAFLDICAFFSYWEWEEVACIVGEENMKCLEEGALIKRKEEIQVVTKKKANRINIHDILLQVGRNKSKDSRLRTADEFKNVLQNKKSLSQIKGIWLEWSEIPFHISAEVLDEMSGSLRVFSMGGRTIVKGKCTKHFNELRFLEAREVPNLPIDVSKLTRLAYISCSLENNTILSQCKNLSSLKVVKFRNKYGTSEIGHPPKLKQLVIDSLNIEKIPCLDKFSNLEKLTLSGCCILKELSKGIRKLSSLRELNLCNCSALRQLPSGIGQLSSLTTLNLSGCRGLQELPTNFENLCSLQYLNLESCLGLLRLPCNFERLSSLQDLDLRFCCAFLELPERIGNLPFLTCLQLHGCKKLSSFPRSLGQMTSLVSSHMTFQGCSSLTELPEEISWLAKLKSISFRWCSSLKMIPNQLSKLTCLEELDLSGCTSLEEICNDFLCLSKLRTLDMSGCTNLSRLPEGFGLLNLKTLDMSGCTNLSRLPEGFGQLASLEQLDLSRCDKLKELSNDFHCLVGLKKLNLRRCLSLSKFPDNFGQLDCVEEIDLSKCSNLEKLCDSFSCLPSLISLELSNCKKLGAEWMDVVGSIPNLWFADIEGSELMIQRWMEMQREKEKWRFVVLTNTSIWQQ
ncbi:hypothetical protein KI387_019683, partial [Taxus chinensis]